MGETPRLDRAWARDRAAGEARRAAALQRLAEDVEEFMAAGIDELGAEARETVRLAVLNGAVRLELLITLAPLQVTARAIPADPDRGPIELFRTELKAGRC